MINKNKTAKIMQKLQVYNDV